MKYTLSETEERMWLGHTLHKVIYDADWLKENEVDEEDAVGGWIENEKNLSQDDLCMVTDNAKVCDNARVYGDARVSQGHTTSLKISTTKQWLEYQLEKIKLREKLDAEEKEKAEEKQK